MKILRFVGRIVLYGVGFVGVLIPAPWLALTALVFLVGFFEAWGAVLIALSMDMIWTPVLSFSHPPLFTIVTLAVLAFARPVRRRLFLAPA